MKTLEIDDIRAAQKRVEGHIHQTPILTSTVLNQALGHRFLFKAENQQKVGAFKARGALNTLLWLQENGPMPERIVAYSSGNHAQGVAWACQKLGAATTIYMPESVSAVKLAATRAYGAEVKLMPSRAAAENAAAQAVEKGAYLLPPYDHDQVICGQGTAILEALGQDCDPDIVVAPCGGGGLLSGAHIVMKALKPEAEVVGAEPLLGNDAAQSRRAGHLVRLKASPQTLADGARTLSLSPRTFAYIRQLTALYEIEEQEIVYWTQWLTHLLKIHIEPTSAMTMAAAMRHLKGQSSPKTLLLILSGGNIDAQTMGKIWAEDHLQMLPHRGMLKGSE